jgi:hypothetical protein
MMTTSTISTNYRKKRFSSTSARCNVRPRAQILIIPPVSFADNPFTYVHEVAFEMIWIIFAFKRAEDDRLMKFQRAAEFMRVSPDLTTATHGSPSIVSIAFTFKPKVILPDDS